jgi:SNF2 family DNA or RNA helicase
VLLPGTELRRLTNILGVKLVLAFKDYAVVPHRTTTTMILRNLGYDVPAPIYTRYDFPIRRPHVPMDHQKITAAHLSLNRRDFCLNQMGTGKTMSAYWAADYLMREGDIRRVLVAAPLSTLEPVHAAAIYQNFVGEHQRTFTVLHGTRQTRERLLEHDFDFYIINHDGLEVVEQALAKRKDIDLLILDEGAVYRNASTNRWKALQRFIKPAMWVWELSGAPTPNEPTDAYAQVKLVKPENLDRYRSMRAFKQATMDQINMFRWEPKEDAMETVYSVMQPSIRFSRDECVDLPACTTTTLDVAMTAPQQQAYKSMLKSLVAEVNGGTVTALNEAVKVMRLIQVSSGVVYDQHGVHQHMDCAPRLTILQEIIDEAPAKVIVYVPYKGNITFLGEKLRHYSVATVSGDTPKKQRDDIFKAFQNDKTPRLLIAHPACMAHGLTLTEAATVVWWAPTDSNEDYEQANDRINRIGQRNSMAIIHLAGSAAERKRYKQLERKQKLQGILLELVEEAKR